METTEVPPQQIENTEKQMDKIDDSMIKESILEFPLSPIFAMNQLQQGLIAQGKKIYKFGFG